MRFRGMRVYPDLRDIWVGAYWDFDRRGCVWRLRVYVCLLPCLPIRLTWGSR